MNKMLDKACCSDVEWVGRAHCDKCHIRQFMLFSDLPETAFDDTLQPIEHFLYPPNYPIYEENVDKKFVYSIRRGLIKLERVTENGINRIVRLIGPGSAIGLELIDGADNYHHTAVSLTEVDLCKIPVSTINKLEINHPSICKHIREQLQNQLNLADKWIMALGTGTAKQRVAHLLLILDEFLADENGVCALLSREEMANTIGITVETVSRILAEFKRQKVLNKATNKVCTCNVPALQNIVRE
jgi:CRP-like cAMP-binding protein